MFAGAKRIGLLFSGAEIDWDLDPALTKDIPDITIGEELFSDGKCAISVHSGYSWSHCRVRFNVSQIHAATGEKEKDCAPGCQIHSFSGSNSVCKMSL